MQDEMNTVILEQTLNGIQFGLMLFLLAAGLTLVFGIMDLVNLSHGSLYMIGAYLIATFTQALDSFWLGMLLGIGVTACVGVLLEMTILRQLYKRDHLSQVLGTFAIILIANESVRILWGPQPLTFNPPASLAGPVELFPGFEYPAYRLAIMAVGALVAAALYVLISKTRIGMKVRAGAADREMAEAMGAKVSWMFSGLFACGAALCALAGGMLGPLLAVQVGMGESILILAFVVVVIGGIGSVRGAFVGSLLVGMIDTLGRAVIPSLFSGFGPEVASSVAPALAAILIYLLMAAILFWKPKGLFPVGA